MYAPGITYHGDQYLAGGIQSLGESIAKAHEERKRNATKAKSLRQLGGIYAPEQKDYLQTLGLDDLEAAVAGFALKADMKRQQTQEDLARAQIRNLSADNTRADANMEILKQTAQRTQARDTAQAGFAKDYAQGAPLVLRPDLYQEFQGPAGRFRYAAGRNPGAIGEDVIRTLASHAAASEDPLQQTLATAKVMNAQAAVDNANRPPKSTEKTDYQKDSVRLRERSMNFQERRKVAAEILAQMKEIVGTSPAEIALKKQLQERLDALQEVGASESGAGPSVPSLGFDHFQNVWRKAKGK